MNFQVPLNTLRVDDVFYHAGVQYSLVGHAHTDGRDGTRPSWCGTQPLYSEDGSCMFVGYASTNKRYVLLPGSEPVVIEKDKQ